MNHDSTPPAYQFGFLVSLVDAFAAVKPKRAGHTTRHHGRGQDAPYAKTLTHWVTTVRGQQHPQLPGDTVATFFRLFFPEEDVARRYGLQETRLAGYLAGIYGVSTAEGCRGAALRAWSADRAVGCLGAEVKRLLEGTSSSTSVDARSMAEIDTLLTELAATCAFSSSAVRGPHGTGRRKPRDILSDLFKHATPSSASLIAQIILKDIRPLLYPLKETHYTAQLLQYNSHAVCMLSKEDAMKSWDPSGRMSQAYRVQASLEEAANALENPEGFVQPVLGVPIPIPKCVKGRGCKDALNTLRRSKKAWVETKYDGERAQIHVQIEDDGRSRITIFSKSKRDSTLDRFGVHDIIRDALNLPDPSLTQDGPTREVHRLPRIKKNIVFEAEMVAFSDTLNRIDEFWQIRSLIASTAIGVRGAARKKAQPESQENENDWSQSSLLSNGSDQGTRHLALVFFDILVLDSNSLLWEPYSKRRALLESVVRQRPGYAMLAERVPILMTCSDEAEDDLIHIFAQLQADHQEGAVLKADEGKYNDYSLRWVKLKVDYIEGYGDCLDMVLLGAGWDKERARELLVSPSAYTTFYVGALCGSSTAETEPPKRPRFQVIFTVSYGLSREQLEELNFLIKNSDPVDFSGTNPAAGLPYDFALNPGLARPSVMLPQPLLVEVFGAGFTKAPGSKFYELRFPRMTKYHRSTERPWTEGTTIEQFQRVARESVGRDRPDKDVDDWCNNVWGKPSSPDIRCSAKRKAREEEWVEKLAKADGKLKVKARRLDFSVRTRGSKDSENASSVQHATSPRASSSGLRTFGSVTNLLLTPPTRSPPSENSNRVSQLPTPGPSANVPHRTVCIKPSQAPAEPPVVFHSTPRSPQPRDLGNSATQCDRPPQVQKVPQMSASTSLPLQASTPATAITPAFTTRSCTIRSFLQHAAVWLVRDSSSARPHWRAPSRSVVPHGQQVHSLNSLMIACGWGATGHVCDWAKYGVVFVDDADPKFSWMDGSVKQLMAWRTASQRTDSTCEKPIVVLGMSLLSRDMLDVERNILDHALCRFG